MITVRLLIYDLPSENLMALQMAKSKSDGLHAIFSLGTLRIITLKRGGWLRQIWHAYRQAGGWNGTLK